MKYIAEFNRSRPLFECVEHKVFPAALPQWEAHSTKFSKQFGKWLRQFELWEGKLQSEASLMNHELSCSQALAIRNAVSEITEQLELLHLRGPDLEIQMRLAWNLHTMGRSRSALIQILELSEEVAANFGEDSTSYADFLWKTSELHMALGNWPAAFLAAESAKITYISNLGEGSEEDLKCHWTMAHSQLLAEDYALAEELALSYSDGQIPSQTVSSIYPAKALQLLAVVQGTGRNFDRALAFIDSAQYVASHLENAPADFLPRLEVFKGILLRKLRIWERAELCLLRGKEQLAALLSPKHLDVGRASLETARFYVLQADHTAADSLFEEALAIFKPLKQARQERAIAAFFRTRLFRIQGKKGKAKNATRIGCKACIELGNPLSEWALRLRLEVIHLLMAAEDFDKALSEIRDLLVEGGFALQLPQLGELKLLQGRALLALGDTSAARELLESVVDFQEEPEDLPLAAHAYQDLAEGWIAERDFSKARACLSSSAKETKVTSLDRSLLGGKHEYLHGRMALLEGNYQSAVTYFENGAEILYEKNQQHEYLQAECWLGKAEALIAQNDWGSAIDLLKQHADSKALKKFQTEGHRARVQYLLGVALFLAGNTKKSHGYVKKAINRLESNAAARHNHEFYLDASIQLAAGCKERNSYSEATESLTAMLGHLKDHVNRYPKKISTVHLLLGEAFAGASQIERAVHHYRLSLALRERHVGPSQTATLQVRTQLVELFQAHAMHEEALAELFQMRTKSVFSRGSRADQEITLGIARQQHRLSLFLEALQTLRLLPAIDSGTNIDPLAAAWLTGQCHLGLGEPELTIQAWNGTLDLESSDHSEPLRSQILIRLAEMYGNRRELAPAQLYYGAAYKLLDREGQTSSAFNCLLKSSQLLREQGKFQEYAQCLEQSRTYALEHNGHVSNSGSMTVIAALAEVRQKEGRKEEALELYKSAINLGHAKPQAKSFSVLADCQLQAASLEDSTGAAVRLVWIEKEYESRKVKVDLVFARSCSAFADLFWDQGQLKAAFQRALKAVETYRTLEMSESVEYTEALHRLALLQSETRQENKIGEILSALQDSVSVKSTATFTHQNLLDHKRLLEVQRRAG